MNQLVCLVINVYLIVTMMRRISTRLCYLFCVKNKSQNFFEMNPIYPDMGEKDFDLYNSERKKINVLDGYTKIENRSKEIRDIVRDHIYAKKYDKFKKFSGGKTNKLDKETKLYIAVDSDFDAFIEKFKKDKLVGDSDRNQFKDLLLKLVHQFKCKSEPELIRLFRLNLANMKRKSGLKIKGVIMEEALLKTARLNRNYDSDISDGNLTSDLEEEQYAKILQQIDEKIEQVENDLQFHDNGLPKKLSNYDHDYGWREEQEVEINEDFDYTAGYGISERIKSSSKPPNDMNLQDWSIRTRINRLYFLRRLELLKNSSDQSTAIHQELPLNLKKRQNIMNELANRYKEAELMQEPDINDIYREIDIFLDKVHVKVSPGSKQFENDTSEEVYDKSFPQEDYLWDKMDVEEIVCATMYNPDSIKEISLSEQFIESVTYSPHTEISLNSLPINLYRHSELENFGIFNDCKTKLMKNVMRANEQDFEPVFNDFSVEKATHKYARFERRTKKVDDFAFGKAKRKTAEAEVYLKKGQGKVTINGKSIRDYFGDPMYRADTLKPFIFTDTSGLYDATFNVAGSGNSGQAQCMAFALARALMKINPDHRQILNKFGLVGFDYRQKESKRTNLYSARVRPPYVRR